MKKMIRALFALALAVSMLMGFAGAEEAATQPSSVAHKNTAIVLDGDLSEWNLSDPIVLDKAEQVSRDAHMWAGVNDLSAKVYVAWDENYLYIGAEITENTPYGSIEMLPMDGQDNIQLYLSTNPDADPARLEYDSNDFKVYLIMNKGYWDTAVDRSMVPKDSRKRYISAGLDGMEDVLSDKAAKNGQPEGYAVGTKECVTENGTGFIYEARIPWAAFVEREIAQYCPAIGDTVNFNFLVTDIDYPCPGTEYIPQMNWTGYPTEYIDLYPACWGRLTFAE